MFFKTKKIISLFVSLSILTVLFFDAAAAKNNPDYSIQKKSQSFEILDNFKVIGSSYKPDTPLVIFINDLHSNPQVQQSIYLALKRLDSDGVLSKIFTEGAPEGIVDVSKLIHSDYQKRKKIIDAFLSSGLASGAEVFAVDSGFKDIYGIENWDIYLENLKTAAETYNSGNGFLSGFKEILYANSGKEIRDAIRKISEIHDLSESGLSKNTDYGFLVRNYGEIDKYLKITDLKKRLNEKAAQKDIYSAFEFLKSNVSYKEFININDKYSKSGKEEFLSDFFLLLKNRFNNVLAERSALTELLYLNELKYASNPHTLIYQISLLKKNIIENIPLSYDKEITALYFFLELLDKYASLSVLEEELNELFKNKEIILKTCFKYLPEKDYAGVAKLLSDENILRYYENNIRRDQIFYENIKKNIVKEKINKKAVFNGKTYSCINVAVMGGFHKSTADLFKEDDISFVSLFPVIKESGKSIYKDIMRLSSSALAPPLLSAGVKNNEISALIDFWASFDDIYSKHAVQSVNNRLSEKNIPFKVFIDKEKQIKIKNIKSGKAFFTSIKTFFAKIFARKANVIKKDLTTRKIVAAEYLKTLDSLNGEMPDVVLICFQRAEDIAFYERILEKMRRETGLSNANFKFIHVSESGTGSSFINISEYINSLKSKNEFQSLKNKKWQDLKICAVNIDGLDTGITGRELPFEFNGRKITSFELSLLNGIRACQSFGQNGGLALMNPESVYIGNMIPEGEITIITSMESYGDILDYEMPWIISGESGVKKMYYKFDFDKIKDKLEKKGILERTRNLENGGFRQFETTTGNILFRFQDEFSYSSFFDKMSDLYGRIYSNKMPGGMPHYVDFIQHILIPLLRIKNGEDVLSYFSKMEIDKAFGEFYEEYSSFFDSSLNEEFKNILERISIKTYMQPYSFYASADKPVLPGDAFSKGLGLSVLGEAGNAKTQSNNDFIHSVESEYARLFREISDTKLQEKYYSEERRESVSLYRRIVLDSEKNAENIEKYLNANPGISQNDVKILENLKNLFVSVEYYALEYIRTLDSFENITILGGYIFPTSSIFERLKIMPFVRIIFGMQANFKKEKEKLRKQAYRLYTAGNAVNHSLYNYNSLLSEIDAYIKGKEYPDAKTYLGIEKQWGDRKAIQRILSLIIAAQSVISTVAIASSGGNAALSGSPLSIVGGLLFSLSTGIGLSIFLHRFMVFIGKRNSFYNAKIKKIFSLEGRYFKNLYYASDESEILKAMLADLSELEYLQEENESFTRVKIVIAVAKKRIEEYLNGKREKTLSDIKEDVSEVLSLISNEESFENLCLSLKTKNAYLPDRHTHEAEPSEFVKKSIEESSREYLEKWKNVLNSENFDADKFEIIRQYALQLVKITAFSENSFNNSKNKEQIIVIIQDFIHLYNDTFAKINGMPEDERQKILLEIKSFEETGKYADYYYKLLCHILSADLLNGYRISEKTPLFFLEKIKILPAVRNIMGINFGIHFSEKGFQKGLKGIIRSGNALIPGLYDEGALTAFSIKYLDSKRKPERFDIGINEFWKSRKMLTRMFPLLFFLGNVIANGLYMQPEKLFISFVSGVGIAIFMHWIPIIYSLIDMKIRKVIKKPKYDKKSVKIPPESLRDEIIGSKAENLRQIPYGKMPDIIFISSDIADENVGDIKRFMSDIIRNGNLRNLNIEYISESGSGDSVIDVFSYMSSEEFASKYPEIAAKGISQINAVIMHIDNSNYENIFDTVDFPISGAITTPFEISLLNAVGLIQNGDEGGNIALADPSYVYLGSLSRSGDVTLLGSDLDYAQIRSQEMPVFIGGEPGEQKPGESIAKKIYKTFDIEKISNIILRSSLENILKNHGEHKGQISAFSGFSSISLDAAKMKYFSEHMRELKEFADNYKGKKFKIDFFSHIMIPYVMLNNGENIDTYFAKMVSGINDRESRRQYYDFFYRIFEIHKKFHGDQDRILDVNIVRPPESLIGRADLENPYYSEIKTFLAELKNKSAPPSQERTATDVLQASTAAANNTANPVSLSTLMTNEISKRLSSKTKTLIFLTPNLNPDYIRHASASQKAGINSICAAIDGESVNSQASEIIINIPVEDSVISAKASISRNPDNSFIVKFSPLYGGVISDKERDIIKSILSGDGEIDMIRKKIFLSRGMLAFIKEAESDRKDLKGIESIITGSLRNNLLSVVSIDGSGAFAQPKLIDDRFYNDETLTKINFCGVYVNKNISGDFHRLSQDNKNALRLSEDTERFNIFTDNILNVGLMSALFSDASFLLSFNRRLTADIDAEEYKLIRLDKNVFYADPRQYISDLFELINGLSLKKSEGIRAEAVQNAALGKVTPSITLNTVSDIAALENLVDTRVINSVIVSNLFAQTENGSVIGNIFNPMLADLRREMAEIGYKDGGFLSILFEEKSDLTAWQSVNPRFYAAGILLDYLKNKSGGAHEFDRFKKSPFAVKGEKSFEYMTALILSGKKIITEDELAEIKFANAQKWDAALEQVKYMEFVVFKQFEEDAKKMKAKGITLIVKTNLMFLKDSVDFNEGFFEISNNGEAAVLPEYGLTPESFYVTQQLEYLRDVLSAGGFLITNIGSYHDKERISAYLRKKLQNGLNGKMILIFEDEETDAYPMAENTYILASKISENQNVILKTGVSDSVSVEELLEAVKNCGSDRVNIPLSFAGDAGMKFDALRADKKNILKSAYANSSQYYASGYKDAAKNGKLAAEAEKITVSDEEDSVYRITAKGILIFNALYSYIKGDDKKEKELLTYLSESGALFALARKHLRDLDAKSPLMRYIDNLELKNRSASPGERHLYNMQLMGFMNGIIHYKYGSEQSLFKAKVSAFADSFYIKNNFFNFIPSSQDTMSLYGLYLGSKDKINFVLKLREYFKHWETIYDKGNNAVALLWLAEQASLFMKDLDAAEKYEFASKIVSYFNNAVDKCAGTTGISAEYDALYLNALLVCRDFNRFAGNHLRISHLDDEIDKEKNAINERYLNAGAQKRFNPDIILLFSLSGLNGIFKDEDRQKAIEDFEKHSLNSFGGVKNGKAYPYYLYYYSLFIPYLQKKSLLETLSFYIEENLSLPEFFARKDGFGAGGNFRDAVSAAYFTMMFDGFEDLTAKIKISKKEFGKMFESVKEILVAA
ncbi:MAG: hypothetical protein FWD54_00230 [Endomicrobia bacterium]|nr:hypothetical protein [Endomicrobiia bacterium]